MPYFYFLFLIFDDKIFKNKVIKKIIIKINFKIRKKICISFIFLKQITTHLKFIFKLKNKKYFLMSYKSKGV